MGVTVKDAVGAGLAGGATVTLRVVVAVAPPLSVTVSVTVYVPAAAYVCDTVFAGPAGVVVLSPQFHA